MVSPVEANPNRDKISDESPVGEALFGKKVGDAVTVNTPGGKTKLRDHRHPQIIRRSFSPGGVPRPLLSFAQRSHRLSRLEPAHA